MMPGIIGEAAPWKRRQTMKTFTTLAALSLCLTGTAYAQMDQSQSQDTRAALNSQQASAAQQQLDQNAANQADHDAAEAARAQTIDNQQANYDAAMHEHHMDVHAYHRAMRQWHADVAACDAGDQSRCGHPEPRE
jgi:hypothetical protein